MSSNNRANTHADHFVIWNGSFADPMVLCKDADDIGFEWESINLDTHTWMNEDVRVILLTNEKLAGNLAELVKASKIRASELLKLAE